MPHHITRSQPSRQMRRLRPSDLVNAVGYIALTFFAGALVAQWWLG